MFSECALKLDECIVMTEEQLLGFNYIHDPISVLLLNTGC